MLNNFKESKWQHSYVQMSTIISRIYVSTFRVYKCVKIGMAHEKMSPLGWFYGWAESGYEYSWEKYVVRVLNKFSMWCTAKGVVLN